MLKTAFWTRAANSLPAHVRERYLAHFVQAERWELALDSIVELFSVSLPRRPGRSEASSSSSG